MGERQKKLTNMNPRIKPIACTDIRRSISGAQVAVDRTRPSARSFRRGEGGGQADSSGPARTHWLTFRQNPTVGSPAPDSRPPSGLLRGRSSLSRGCAGQKGLGSKEGGSGRGYYYLSLLSSSRGRAAWSAFAP